MSDEFLSEDAMRKDFRLFVWCIFKHYLYDVQADPTPIQYDIAAYLANHPSRNKVIMAFRGIGKTYITALYCMWRLWNNPELAILVISASKDHADKISTFMWRLMKEVPFLEHMDPDKHTSRAGRTSRLEFDIVGAPNKPSASVTSRGITGMITGSRADIIIADDIEIPNNSDTPMKREKLVLRTEEFDAILTTKADAEVVFLGTPQSQDSVYNQLPYGELGFDIRIWPALYPEDAGAREYYGSRLAPSIAKKLDADPGLAGKPTDTRFDEKQIEKRRARYGKSGFALQFLLNTTLSDALKYPLKCRDFIVMDLDKKLHPERPIWASGDETQIRDAICDGFTGDAFFRPMTIEGEWVEYQGAVMTIDPSGKGKDETGYCIAKWGGGYIYVLDVGAVVGGFEEETLKDLAQIAHQWDVTRVVPERNMGGGMFGELLRPIFAKHAPNAAVVPVEEMPHHSIQKEVRIIETCEPLMNMHRVVINKAILETDRRKVAEVGDEKAQEYRFFYQLTRITRERQSIPKDDRLDAFAMAMAEAQYAMGLDPEHAMEERQRGEYEAAMDRYLESGDLLNSPFEMGYNDPYDDVSWI